MVDSDGKGSGGHRLSRQYWQEKLNLSATEYQKQKGIIYVRYRKKWLRCGDLIRDSPNALIEVKEWILPVLESLEINIEVDEETLTKYAGWAIYLDCKSKDEAKGRRKEQPSTNVPHLAMKGRKALSELEDIDSPKNLEGNNQVALGEHDIELDDFLDTEFTEAVGGFEHPSVIHDRSVSVPNVPSRVASGYDNGAAQLEDDVCMEDADLMPRESDKQDGSRLNPIRPPKRLKLIFRHGDESQQSHNSSGYTSIQPGTSQPPAFLAEADSASTRVQGLCDDRVVEATLTQMTAPQRCRRCIVHHRKCEADEDSSNGSCQRCTKASQKCSNASSENSVQQISPNFTTEQIKSVPTLTDEDVSDHTDAGEYRVDEPQPIATTSRKDEEDEE